MSRKMILDYLFEDGIGNKCLFILIKRYKFAAELGVIHRDNLHNWGVHSLYGY